MKLITEDELVEVYRCDDGSWRIAYYPFSDKDRMVNKGDVLDIAEQRYKEARELFDSHNLYASG